MQKDEYKTKDIGEAAALYTSDIKLLRLDKDNNFFWFVFEGSNAKKISNSYWSAELTLIAKKYNDSFRTLKERLFANQ